MKSNNKKFIKITNKDYGNGIFFHGIVNSMQLPKEGQLSWNYETYLCNFKGSFGVNNEGNIIMKEGSLEKKDIKNKELFIYEGNFEQNKLNSILIEKGIFKYSYGFDEEDKKKVCFSFVPNKSANQRNFNYAEDISYKYVGSVLHIYDDKSDEKKLITFEEWKKNNKTTAIKHEMLILPVLDNANSHEILKTITRETQKLSSETSNAKVQNHKISDSIIYNGLLQNDIPQGEGTLQITNHKGDITRYYCLFNEGKIEKYQKISIQEKNVIGQLGKETFQKYNVITRDDQLLEELNDIQNIEKNIEIIISNNNKNHSKSNIESEINFDDLNDLVESIKNTTKTKKGTKNNKDFISKNTNLNIVNENLFSLSINNDKHQQNLNNTIILDNNSLEESHTFNTLDKKETNLSSTFDNLSNIIKQNTSLSLFESPEKIEEEEKESNLDLINEIKEINKTSKTNRTLEFSNVNLNLNDTTKNNEVEKMYLIPNFFHKDKAIQVKLGSKIEEGLDKKTFEIAKSVLTVAEINGIQGQETQGTCFKVTKNGLFELKIQGHKSLQNCRIFGTVDEEGVLILNDIVGVKSVKHSNNNDGAIYDNKLSIQNRNNVVKLVDLTKETSEDSTNTFNKTNPNPSFKNIKGLNNKYNTLNQTAKNPGNTK